MISKSNIDYREYLTRTVGMLPFDTFIYHKKQFSSALKNNLGAFSRAVNCYKEYFQHFGFNIEFNYASNQRINRR